MFHTLALLQPQEKKVFLFFSWKQEQFKNGPKMRREQVRECIAVADAFANQNIIEEEEKLQEQEQ